jgi:hypothetical protein
MQIGTPGETTDHPDHRSCWFGHGDIIPKGIGFPKVQGVEGIDFWTDREGHGLIVCKKVGEPASTNNQGGITIRSEWQTAGSVKIMGETRTIQVYELTDARLIVFAIDLRAFDVPITFADSKDGGFAVRVNDVLREQGGNGKIEDAAGRIGEKACWGQVANWCDFSGKVEGKKVGVAILADPSNPYPSCWHCRGYGLMAANPFGRAVSGFPAMQGKKDVVTLAKGEHLRLRYGVLAHLGDAKTGKVAEHYQQFITLQ